MSLSEEFFYTPVGSPEGEQRLRPVVTLIFADGERRIQFPGLVDSGADINVLPYSLGLALGLNWETARQGPTLGGRFASARTRMVVLWVQVRELPSIRLVFTWVAEDFGPVILGQMNFFNSSFR